MILNPQKLQAPKNIEDKVTNWRALFSFVRGQIVKDPDALCREVRDPRARGRKSAPPAQQTTLLEFLGCDPSCIKKQGEDFTALSCLPYFCWKHHCASVIADRDLRALTARDVMKTKTKHSENMGKPQPLRELR